MFLVKYKYILTVHIVYVTVENIPPNVALFDRF